MRSVQFFALLAILLFICATVRAEENHSDGGGVPGGSPPRISVPTMHLRADMNDLSKRVVVLEENTTRNSFKYDYRVHVLEDRMDKFRTDLDTFKKSQADRIGHLEKVVMQMKGLMLQTPVPSTSEPTEEPTAVLNHQLLKGQLKVLSDELRKLVAKYVGSHYTQRETTKALQSDVDSLVGAMTALESAMSQHRNDVNEVDVSNKVDNFEAALHKLRKHVGASDNMHEDSKRNMNSVMRQVEQLEEAHRAGWRASQPAVRNHSIMMFLCGFLFLLVMIALLVVWWRWRKSTRTKSAEESDNNELKEVVVDFAAQAAAAQTAAAQAAAAQAAAEAAAAKATAEAASAETAAILAVTAKTAAETAAKTAAETAAESAAAARP